MYRGLCLGGCFVFVLLGVRSLAQSAPDMPTLFARLNQAKTTDRAAQQVLEAVRKDPGQREYIVQRLPQMIEKPVSDEIRLNAVRLAGQLKALETIPSLQKALSRGPQDGPRVYSMTGELRLDYDVVAKTLSRMGDSAIPAVTSLLESEDPKTRRRAVLILRNTDTRAARKVLEDVFHTKLTHELES